MPRRQYNERVRVPQVLYLADSLEQCTRITEILRKCRGEYAYRTVGYEVNIEYPGPMPKHFVERWSHFIAGVLCADANPKETKCPS